MSISIINAVSIPSSLWYNPDKQHTNKHTLYSKGIQCNGFRPGAGLLAGGVKVVLGYKYTDLEAIPDKGWDSLLCYKYVVQ